MSELDHPQAQLATATNTPSEAVVVQPGESATNVIGVASEELVTPQTAPTAITPVVAPTAATPDATTPVVVARAPVVSAMSLLLVSLLAAILVVLLILIFRQRRYRQSLLSES